jgi:hypothetical protein
MTVKKPTPEEVNTASSWGAWSKEPSQFPWFYDEKETCYILEGEASVTDSAGHTIRFGSGDWVEFEEGLTCTWIIHKTIRKRYKMG